jgi:anion-transporting  ArsA/GET3 family ATPase
VSENGGALEHALTNARVIVTVGSGGVGKTTSAAAIGIAAARRGRRAAVLTIDPAKRLAQALGLEKMGNEPRPIDAELVKPGSVDAMMLETGNAFDDLIHRLVPDEERRDKLLANRLYQVIARQLGGTHEYMAVEKLYELTRDDAYDLVVLDTPPSVNALDFLDAPKRLSSFFSEKITRFFIKRSEAQKKGLLAKLRDRAGELAVGLLSKALGSGFLEETQEFATAFQELFVEFRKRGLAIEELLTQSDTAFLVVSGADPVRVQEAVEFARALKKFGIKPTAFVANRVHLAPADAEVKLDTETLKAALGDADVEPLRQGLENARQVRAALARRDRRGLVEMAKHAGKGKLLVVPELDHEVEDRGAVEHVIRALAGDLPVDSAGEGP